MEDKDRVKGINICRARPVPNPYEESGSSMTGLQFERGLINPNLNPNPKGVNRVKIYENISPRDPPSSLYETDLRGQAMFGELPPTEIGPSGSTMAPKYLRNVPTRVHKDIDEIEDGSRNFDRVRIDDRIEYLRHVEMRN